MKHSKINEIVPPENGATKKISTPTTSENTKQEPKNTAKKEKKKNKSVLISILQSLIYIICIVLVSVFLAVNCIKIANDIFAFKKDSANSTAITIDQNSTVSTIAHKLKKSGIIEYENIFKFYGKFKKDEGTYKAGTYTLDSSMDYDTIRSTLKFVKSENKDVRITIPEGYKVDQIIDLLVQNNIGSREKYEEVINNYDFEFDFLPAIETLDTNRTYRLEGYLFPDTYDFNPSESEATVLYKFLRNFKNKFEDIYYERAKKLGMSVDEVITLASIIEQEVRFPADYEKVSSVFHNRLNSKAFTKLESCATINYFLKEHALDITAEMIKIDNPYNTYMYEGLTPGPICNPGNEAIAYAFYPAKTNYYYFVSQDDGVTMYGTTLAEHNNNKAKAAKANELYRNKD